jgi:hypothetical protein
MPVFSVEWGVFLFFAGALDRTRRQTDASVARGVGRVPLLCWCARVPQAVRQNPQTDGYQQTIQMIPWCPRPCNKAPDVAKYLLRGKKAKDADRQIPAFPMECGSPLFFTGTPDAARPLDRTRRQTGPLPVPCSGPTSCQSVAHCAQGGRTECDDGVRRSSCPLVKGSVCLLGVGVICYTMPSSARQGTLSIYPASDSGSSSSSDHH